MFTEYEINAFTGIATKSKTNPFSTNVLWCYIIYCTCCDINTSIDYTNWPNPNGYNDISRAPVETAMGSIHIQAQPTVALLNIMLFPLSLSLSLSRNINWKLYASHTN